MAGYKPFFGKEMLAKLRGNDVEGRREMVDRLAEAYKQNFFNRQEQRLADAILRVLVNDKDEPLRESLAHHLKSSTLLPHDVVMDMARDDSDKVALPVLENSYILSEDDLTQLISGQIHSPRLEAIARREAISAKVSNALLYKRIPEVMSVLFENPGALLDQRAVLQVVEKMPPSEELMELLHAREDITKDTRNQLDRLAKQQGLVVDSNVPDLPPEALTEAARIYSLLGMTLEEVQSEGLARIVSRLSQERRLSVSLLIRCLSIGELSLVEYAMAHMAGVPHSNSRILLRDKGGKGVEALYKASRLPSQYSQIFVSLVKLLLNDPTLATLHPRLLERHLLIAIADDNNEKNVDFASAIIKRAMQDMEAAEARLLHIQPLVVEDKSASEHTDD